MAKVLNRRLARVAADAVYVGRGSVWGNPFVIGKDGDRESVIAKYRRHLWSSASLMDRLPELYGKDLVCWCSPMHCHGDVLLAAAKWHSAKQTKAA